MTELTPASFNAARTIGLVQGMLVPREIQVAPPNLYYESTFLKALTVQGNFNVQDQSLLIEEKVPTSTGAVVWFPQRGINSIYRYGLVGKNTVSYTQGFGGIPPGRTASPGLISAMRSGGAAEVFFDSLVYQAPLWLPYGDAAGFNDQITISPSLDRNVSFARVIAGEIEMISDTQSIGNTALTGRLAWGAVADTRDVAQALQDGSINYHAYDPADLQQMSVTSKDGEVESSIMSGAIALVGPDIAPWFSAPTADDQDYICGQWTQQTNRAGAVTTQFGANSGTWNLPTLVNLDSTWISPWNINMTPDPNTTVFGHFTNMDGPSIDECGVLDVRIDTAINWAHIGTDINVGNALFKINVIGSHFYATVQGDGRITYTVRSHIYFEKLCRVGDVQAFNAFTCDFTDATFKRTGYIEAGTGGKYIGTLVNLAFEGVRMDPYAGADEVQFTINPSVFTLRGRTVGQKGYVGPARIFRYDNVSSGQNVRLTGILNAQLVPQGFLAPYTQNQAASTARCVDLNAIPLAAQLWNAPNTPFRRIYNLTYYKDVIRPMAMKLGPQNLLEIAAENPELLAAFSSSGVFHAGADWSAIGSAVGGSLGGPLGASLGHVGGAAVNWLGGLFGAGDFDGDERYTQMQSGPRIQRILGPSATNMSGGDGYRGAGTMRRQRM